MKHVQLLPVVLVLVLNALPLWAWQGMGTETDPYLINTDLSLTIPSDGGTAYGRQVDVPGYSLRGTLDTIDNETAAQMGAYILQSDAASTATDGE